MKADRQRLDKWLWFARFAKSRALAARLVTDGFVRVNGVRAQSTSRAVACGDVLTVAAAHATATVRIRDLGDRRGPAPEARLLYDDLSAGASDPATNA
ncbi:RNA-binding protein [Methylobacterium sp. Leaf399]|uniref:RNA-binding S4 domain-containing protein n=1 Tax=unclassified Methylobacterium TaxID=2615210 RepID=UPI0006FAC204|nr:MULTISPECIES: RNA-binding S4 domain-containing protein [unclassified Methylobacterium]KQP54969.1 RNA-binding protein [Methylobacterium sp. Leaf108]KQT09135.1 RNA-binding protein [Methylobacterium sp. Leaf399]KQT78941.1 RNA-binding protein [Methylobacterium sp. Leaf466]